MPNFLSLPLEDSQENKTEGRDFFTTLPDELLVLIFKSVPHKELIDLKETCKRFQSLILDYTVRLDYEAIQWDSSLKSEEDLVSLILSSPRLRSLSLIKEPLESQEPSSLIPSVLSSFKTRKKFAEQLSVKCPGIRVFEVSGMNGLRLVRDYSKITCKKTRGCQLQELRLYCKEEGVSLARLLISISMSCPSLKIFKWLRRTSQDVNNNRQMLMKNKMYSQVFSSLTALTGFSTNIINRDIISSSLTTLINLTRLVVWHLNQEEVEVLTKQLKALQILVLMSVEVAAVKRLKRLNQLKELTISLKRDTSFSQIQEEETSFQEFFRIRGSQLKLLSLNFKGKEAGRTLDHLTKYCVNLDHLKLREFQDLDNICNVLLTVAADEGNENQENENASQDIPLRKEVKQLLPSLQSFVWMDPQGQQATQDTQVIIGDGNQANDEDKENQAPNQKLILFQRKKENERERQMDSLSRGLFSICPSLTRVTTPYKSYYKKITNKHRK